MIPSPLQSVFTTDDSLVFIFFIAYSLMIALGLRFAFYGFLNKRASNLDAQALFWDYLIFVGVTAALYGVLGLIEAMTAATQPTSVVTTPFRDGVFLAFLFLLALTMREIYHNDALTNAGDEATTVFPRRKTIERVLTAVILVSLVGSGVAGTHIVVTTLNGLGAIGIASYGLVYGRQQLTRTSVRGTMIDSLLRHLLPVLTFGLLVVAIGLTALAGLDAVIISYIQVVFVIMTATTLMTATIKLRQNVASF